MSASATSIVGAVLEEPSPQLGVDLFFGGGGVLVAKRGATEANALVRGVEGRPKPFLERHTLYARDVVGFQRVHGETLALPAQAASIRSSPCEPSEVAALRFDVLRARLCPRTEARISRMRSRSSSK